MLFNISVDNGVYMFIIQIRFFATHRKYLPGCFRVLHLPRFSGQRSSTVLYCRLFFFYKKLFSCKISSSKIIPTHHFFSLRLDETFDDRGVEFIAFIDHEGITPTCRGLVEDQ